MAGPYSSAQRVTTVLALALQNAGAETSDKWAWSLSSSSMKSRCVGDALELLPDALSLFSRRQRVAISFRIGHHVLVFRRVHFLLRRSRHCKRGKEANTDALEGSESHISKFHQQVPQKATAPCCPCSTSAIPCGVLPFSWHSPARTVLHGGKQTDVPRTRLPHIHCLHVFVIIEFERSISLTSRHNISRLFRNNTALGNKFIEIFCTGIDFDLLATARC